MTTLKYRLVLTRTEQNIYQDMESFSKTFIHFESLSLNNFIKVKTKTSDNEIVTNKLL